MAKPNYSFEKRKRDMEKKAKKAEAPKEPAGKATKAPAKSDD